MVAELENKCKNKNCFKVPYFSNKKKRFCINKEENKSGLFVAYNYKISISSKKLSD